MNFLNEENKMSTKSQFKVRNLKALDLMIFPIGPASRRASRSPDDSFRSFFFRLNMASKTNSKTDKGFKVIYFSYATYC